MARALLIAAATWAALLVCAAPAVAQRSSFQAEAEIERLLEDARAFYDNLELDQAEQALERAVQLGERYDVKNRTMAEVHVQRGILAHVRDKDQERAVGAFREALLIDMNVKLDPLVSTPSLEKLFAQARKEAGGRAEPEERPRPSRDEQVVHQPLKRARGGENVTITLKVSDEIDAQIYRVYLYFRSARADSVQRVEMKPEEDRSFSGKIPGRFVAGKALSYYVLIEDRAGRVIGGVRSAQDPIVVEVTGDALGDVDEIASGDSLTGEEGGSDDEPDTGGKKRRFVSLTFSVGSGAGFITDRATPENQKNDDIRPGAALAPFHTLIELDFWATKRFALGAYGRIQIIEFAHLEGGRLKFVALDEGDHHLVVRAGGGIGKVRHLVDLGEVLDTTLEGPYHYTVGASYVLDLNQRLAFVAGPDFIHLIGDSPSLHFDVNLGLQISF